MASPSIDACPTDDTLGALVEHALDDGEAARVSSHIDTCDACRAIVIAAVKAPGFARGTPSLPGIEVRADASLEGKRMGRYELRELLGAGGMGQVYSAYDAELDRTIAVKVLRPELAKTASVLADRLVRESRLMAKITHPSVITVYDVGREGDAVFIAMELVRGETLASYIARTKPGWREVAVIFERAGQGLAAAHDAGIVHRDFKPENVLVDGAGKIVVTDFGIATAALESPGGLADRPRAEGDASGRLTETGVAIGTPSYMAPEQLAGGVVDRRADVFAFSVSLWEALFGQRPFLGKTVDEIREAMKLAPKAGAGVPARITRVLERGLSIDPAQRPELRAIVRELAPRAPRRTAAITAAIGLAGAGIAAAVMLAGNDEKDPCAKQLGVPELALDATAKKKLGDSVAAWRTTQAATCDATREPVQSSMVTACLEARKLEIDAFVEEARRSGVKASKMIRIVVDPARCKDPKQGLLFARVPADADLRRAAADLRYRAFDIEAARDRSEFATALPQAKQLVEETKSAWPPVHAEALYLLGTTQAQGGDVNAAIASLREAAALGERTHHAYIAANSWIQLIYSAAFDAADPTRALEYATYADAALDGIGRPPDLEVLFLYFKGSSLLEADQPKEAEVLLRRAVELATQHAPAYLARATLGLGYLFEEQGRYGDAVAMYRRAIQQLQQSSVTTSSHTFRERLALNLALLGKTHEAETVAREAVAIAERTLGEDNIDRAISRANLAQVLQRIGKPEQALVEARLGTRLVGKILGERNERYGEMLSLEGNILVELEQFAEANKTLGRACEIIAFGVGDASTQVAECLLSQSIALDGLGKSKDALVIVERATEILILVDGELHPRVASALVQRGALRAFVGRYAEAIPDLERAIAAFEQLQLEPGHLGGAKWALGKTLWSQDRPRAKKLIEEAIALFDEGNDTWAQSKTDAEAWLRTNGRP